MTDHAGIPPNTEIPSFDSFHGTGLESLRRSLACLPVPAAIVELESNRIVAMNRQFAESLHLPLESIQGRTPDELGFRSNSDDRKAVLDGTADGGIHHTHRRTKLPDGNWKEFIDSSRRILVDGKECLFSCYEPASAMVANADSIRRAKEEELRESEEKFRLLADCSSDMISRHDPDGRFLYVSPSCRKLTGRGPEEIVGRDAFFMVDEKDRSRIQAMLSTVVASLSPIRLEYRLVRSDDSTIWVESVAQAILDPRDRSILELQSSTRDVSERRESERKIQELNESLERRVGERTCELQSAMKEMESFSYSISHDLRSPLRAIDGFSMALLEDAQDQLPPESRMYLDRIRAASQRMGNLIDDLLELSRSSRVEMVRQDIDISALARQILEDLSRQSMPRKSVLKVAPGISAQGDEVLVRSVLENLLGNAWKYSSLKPESVIELTSEVKEDRQWIVIRDNGIGFDMDHADKLFGTFQRLHPAGQFEGTGIGLATVRKIVERHGGNVTGSGIPGEGAVFRFTLDPSKGMVA